MSDAIDTRLAASLAALVNPETAKLIFSVQGHNATPPNYMRNTSSWCYDLRQQMTCISPWNSSGLNLGTGTAITAQHIISAYHNKLPLDATVRFITANNVIVEKIIRGRADNLDCDVSVYTLDSLLPATITPCKVLPANYANYLSYLGGGRPPVMFLDQEEKATVRDLRTLEYRPHSTGFGVHAIEPTHHPDRLQFYEATQGGDSGDPIFLIVNNELALLHVLSVAEGGPFVSNCVPTLNAMIVAADANATARGYPQNTGLPVETVNLSGFPFLTPPP